MVVDVFPSYVVVAVGTSKLNIIVQLYTLRINLECWGCSKVDAREVNC